MCSAHTYLVPRRKSSPFCVLGSICHEGFLFCWYLVLICNPWWSTLGTYLFLYLPSLYFVWKCWNSGLELMTSLLYHHAQLATCISSLLVFVHFINWIVLWLFNFKVLLIYFGPIVYQILSYSLVCSLIVDSCSKLKFFLLLIKPCFLLILYIMPLVFKKKSITTGDVAKWLEYWPGMYKVLGSILKCQHTHDHLMFVLPSSLSCFSYICLLWRDVWAIVYTFESQKTTCRNWSSSYHVFQGSDSGGQTWR